MAIVFEERSSGREPSGRFGIDLAEYNRTYALFDQALGVDAPVSTEDLAARILLVTGTTLPGPATPPLGAPGGKGSIVRLMPMCDPQFNSLFADVPAVRVPTGEGYSPATIDATLRALLAVPPIVAGYSRYNCYEFDVPYSPRPFTVIPNERMVAFPLDFYDVDGSRKRLTYYQEWIRYVQTFVDDVDSRVSASVGSSMVFRVPSKTKGQAPDGMVYSGIPDMIMPDQLIKLRWFGVPARYVASPNSYLVRYKGFINQVQFLDCVPGALLYLGAKTVRAYYPPQFTPVILPADPVLSGTFGAEPLLDLDLSFIFTARRRCAKEAGPFGFSTVDPDVIPAIERPNKSWIDGPHNWLPAFVYKRFWYAHANVPDLAKDTPNYAQWMPSYNSVPHQILFQDPSVPGVVVDIP